MGTTGRGCVVLIAGSRWENTPGTDHRLATALAGYCDVLWVDPPLPAAGPAVVDRPAFGRSRYLDGIGEGLLRLRVIVPPGPSKPGLRHVADALMWRAIRATLVEIAAEAILTLSLSPTGRLWNAREGLRALHVTDDWVAGAHLMGLSRRYVRRMLAANLRHTDIVTAVSPVLASTLDEVVLRGNVKVLPNGCELRDRSVHKPLECRRPAIALLGQLNERLDLDLLDRIGDSGVAIDVIGPRRDHDAATAARLDGFLRRSNVTWAGEVPADEVSDFLDRASVGITPYKSSAFNQASFPLKTLEYLSAGLPVVATDSPAVRWLDTDLIKVGRTHDEFVSLTIGLAHQHLGPEQLARNKEFAKGHSWAARAEQLMQWADLARSTPATRTAP